MATWTRQRTGYPRGFTLIELLITIAIIAALAGMVLAGTAIVRRQQRVAQTRVQLQGLSLAITSYLSDYGILGDQRVETPTDFAASPAVYLVVRPLASKREPYLTPDLRSLRDSSDATITDPAMASRFVDMWGNDIQFEIRNASSSGKTGWDHTTSVKIRSTRNTPGSTGDDIVYAYTLDKDSWSWE